MQSGVGHFQGFVKKDSADLHETIKEHWMKMCEHLGELLAERVVEARVDQIPVSYGVAGMYVHSRKNRWKCIKQLVQNHTALLILSFRIWGPVLEILVKTTLVSPAQVKSSLMSILDFLLCNAELSSVQYSGYWKKSSKFN